LQSIICRCWEENSTLLILPEHFKPVWSKDQLLTPLLPSATTNPGLDAAGIEAIPTQQVKYCTLSTRQIP
jgi:hypothetical protein